MKYFQKAMLAFAGAGLLWFAACNPVDEKLDSTPQPVAKTVVDAQDYYSPLTGSATLAHKMNVVRYSDGSVDVVRSVVPAAASFTYASYVVDGATSVVPDEDGYEITFAADGWMIPFDPIDPPAAIGGGNTKIYCDCYGGGACGVEMVFVYSNGAANFTCKGSCDEECIRRVEQGYGNPDQNGGAVFLQTSLLNY